MKKIRNFVIVMLVLVFTFCSNNLIGLAENRILANENVYAQYSGSTEASWGYNGNLITEYSNQINIIDKQNADEIKA